MKVRSRKKDRTFMVQCYCYNCLRNGKPFYYKLGFGNCYTYSQPNFISIIVNSKNKDDENSKRN